MKRILALAALVFCIVCTSRVFATTVVQTAIGSSTSNVSTISATFGTATTPGDSIVIVAYISFGSGDSIAASDSGSLLSWTTRRITTVTNTNEGLFYSAALFDSLNTAHSVTTVSVSDATAAQLSGYIVAYEVSGGTASLDFVDAADQGTNGSYTSLTAAGSAETGSTDFVVSDIMLTEYNQAITGLTTASGTPTWTGDSTALGPYLAGNISHRIETSAETPSAGWSWSPASTQVGSFVAAYKFTAPVVPRVVVSGGHVLMSGGKPVIWSK